MKDIVLMLTFLLVSTSFASGKKNHGHKHKNKKPIAKLKVSQKKCDSPCTVTLDGSKSKAAKGKTIAKYIFDLGNGETIESTTPSIEFTYINFKEETDKKKRKKRAKKYKKWKKYIKYCKKRFKNFDKFKIKLQVVQSDDKTSKKAKRLLFVKPSDSMPVIDGDDIIPAAPDQVLSDSTLLGIDSDGDGVRDDVELFINNLYPSNESLRRSSKLYTMYSMKGLEKVEDREESIRLSREALKLNRCIFYLKKDANISSSDSFKHFSSLNRLIINTVERVRAENKADANFNGETISTSSITPKMNCQLNI